MDLVYKKETNQTKIQDCIDELHEGLASENASSYIMIGITLFLLPIMLYMTVKVFRLVWPNEKVVPMMLVMLCLTLVSCIGYYSFIIYSWNHTRWNCEFGRERNCLSYSFSYAPAFCLANSVILNLNKWIYFKLRINAFVKVGFGFNDVLRETVNTESGESASRKERRR